MEHHSNIVPWQMLRDAHGIELRVAPITDCRRTRHGGVRGAAGRRQGRAWSPITHMSNVLGTVTPAERIVSMAHAHGAKVLFDGSQAIVHRARRRAGARLRFLRLDRAQAVWPDRHRRAVGAARIAGTDAAVPRRRRNDLVGHLRKVDLGRVPHKFEAGTPAILEGIGLKAAIDYVRDDRLRRDGGTRGVADRTCAGAAVAHRRSAHPRPGAGSRRRCGVRAGQGARARRRDAARPPGHRGARRPSLRRAADASFRSRQHRARQFRHLHDARGNRRPGRRR